MENFIDSFKEEASGLLAEMEDTLLKLDKNKEDKALINEVFRVMHTLKGTSAMFGFDNIGKLTHQLENIFDLARENASIINDKILNITLEIVDFVKVILNDQDGNNYDKKVDSYIAKLNKISNQLGIEEQKIDIVKEETGLKTFYIVFTPTEQILFRGINLLNIFKDLSRLGKYKIIEHHFIDEEKKDESAIQAWGIYLVTVAEIKDIEDVFIFVIDNCNIVQVAGYNIFKEESVKETFSEGIEKGKKKSIIDIVNEIKEDIEIDDEVEHVEEPEKVLNKKPTADKKRISVSSEKLDRLMNLVSDLVTSNAMLSMASKTKDMEMLENIAEKFERLTRQFRDNTLSIRLVSVKELLLRFKRLVRDLSKELNKEVQFIIEGEDTEMDKNIIDNLSDPLVHIFRNAIDHGIESPEKRKASNKNRIGTIKLSAFYSGTYVYITIQDDGAGIDIEKIKQKAIAKGMLNKDANITKSEVYGLLFKSGFSTAGKVTDVSGRGVGLDVVKSRISELQGEIEVDSEVGLGTTFTIKLQQTISIIDTLLVRSGSSLYLIPQNNIEFCIQEDYKVLFTQLNKRVVFEDQVIPFINIRELFDSNDEIPEKAKLVVVNKNNFKFAIVADEIIGEHQAVIKPLGNILKKQEYFTGVSLLGDGSLAFMIDLTNIQEYFKTKSYAKAG